MYTLQNKFLRQKDMYGTAGLQNDSGNFRILDWHEKENITVRAVLADARFRGRRFGLLHRLSKNAKNAADFESFEM